MNKTILKLASSIIIGAMIVSSCKMQDASPVPYKNESTKEAVEKFFEKNDVPTQTFTISTSSYSTITGSEGTKISIPSNAFRDATGNPVTGNVTISVQEIFDQSDMVFSGVTTQSDSTLLVSGGEIFIGATANGQNVYLNSGTTIQIDIPIDGSADPNMNLFVGDTTESGDVNWIPVDTSQNNPIQVTQDTIGTNGGSYFYYSFNSKTIGWINCDYFYNQATTNLTLNLPSLDALGTRELTGANVFVIYKNINSVAGLYQTTTCQATSCPSSSYTASCGLGQPAILLTVASIDGKLHYNKQDITITTNQVINLGVSDLTEVMELDLQTLIDNL